jgi:ATP-binding cassette, subfamily B, bacterial
MDILIQYLKKHWPVCLLILLLASTNQIFSLIDPIILRTIINDYATKADQFVNQENKYIWGVAGLIGLSMGAAMISRIAKNFQDYFLNVVTQKVGAKMYQDGLKHSLSLPYQVFEDQRSGQTLSILQKARADNEKFLASAVNIVFASVIGFIFVITFTWIKVSWKVAVVFLAATPLIGILSSVLSKNIKRVQKVIVGETTALAGATTESLRNIELIKSLGLSRQEEERLNHTTDKILQLELKKVRYIRSLSFIQGTTINFLRSSILFLMMYLILGHEMAVGDYIMMMIFSFFLFGPLQELGTVIQTYRESEISMENFSNIMEAKPESKPEHPSPISRIENLEFRNVSFKHLTANTPALNHISFKAQQGMTFAFAGPSGSGKTTLVKLLVGLYHPMDGEILYNGIPGQQIDLDGLRGRIGFVTQDTQLFSGTIRENLLFVRPEATDEQCYDVLNKAACQNLLARADKGLDTVIGEGGVKVSGGEKQRLSIARALLRNPDLLVFDEATSSLDSITEDEITQTIREVSNREEQITIMIAHRLSTIMHADQIYVLEKGHIVESGKHYELLEMKGLYYAMWRQQIGENRVQSSVSSHQSTVPSY